ncbi:MAG: metallophosphoesterase family protein [Christensenellales bacterium]
MKKVAKIVLAILMITVIATTLTACQINEKTEIEVFDIDSNVLRVGIISDSQLPPSGEEGWQYYNLKNSLAVLKSKDVDLILFAGDVGDLCKKPAYELYNKAIATVYPDEESRPIIQTIMGNHDYWENGAPISCRSRFEKMVGISPYTHYVVGGYHFIGASPATGSMDNGYKYMKDWLTQEIEKAVADDPNKPIFVTTHNGAVDTMYGSDDWGDYNLDEVFKNYPQVVNFSGHSHYSILDERSIHQRDYTSITTQSVSYTELERGKENGSIPPNAEATPMGFVMDVYSNKIEIHRYNFASQYGEDGKEEKTPWVLPIPLTKDGFTYTTEAREVVNVAPEMTSATGTSVVEEGKTYLQFAAGQDDDFVHSYKMVWSDGSEQLYFSDFYNGLDVMATTPKIEVLNKAQGTYSVKVYAIDSWGKVSQNYTVIEGVTIA